MEEIEYRKWVEKALAYYDKAHIVLADQERASVEIADFGLGDFANTGLTLITYVNTEHCCAKEMVLHPKQTCPEHRHPPLPACHSEGKEETFRCRMGTVYLYVEGSPTGNPVCKPPEADAASYTAMHEIRLDAGEQYTIHPNTKHWFQGGPDGAVVSEFSTKSMDEADVFTDPKIVRAPEVTK
jgi:D-lyxose ketol-isomerase